MVTVPFMVFLGLPLKSAIGISSMQMVLSSLSGTLLNNKLSNTNLKSFYIYVPASLLGGFAGANLVKFLDEKIIAYFFIGLFIFALSRLIKSPTQAAVKNNNKPLLFLVFFLTSALGATLGVGGGAILVPVLIAFFGYNTKEATIISLFFIIFGSLSSFISLSFLGYVPFLKGAIVGIFAIIGMRYGIIYREKISQKTHKLLMIFFYLILLFIFIYKLEII